MWFVFWSRMEPCVCSCLLGMFNAVLKSCSTSLSRTSRRSNKRPAIIYLVGCLPCLRPLSCTPGTTDAWLCCVSDLSLLHLSMFSSANAGGNTPLSLQQLTMVMIVCNTKRCTLSSLTSDKLPLFCSISYIHPLPLHCTMCE